MRKKRSIKTFAVVAILLILLKYAEAQQTINLIQFKGNLIFNSDFYNLDTEEDGVRPKRPDNLQRAIFSPTIYIGEVIFPFTFTFSNNELSSTTPIPSRQSLMDYFSNPMNNFSVTPQYKFITLYIGNQTPQYSQLTTGDQKIFGGGISVNPGLLRVSFNQGRIHEAVDPDEDEAIEPLYQRDFMSFKLGYGDEKKSHLHFNFVKVADDKKSLDETVEKFPEEGFVSSLGMRVNLPAGIYLSSEIAGSGFTRNTRSEKMEISGTDQLDVILENRRSTRYDAAGLVEMGRKGRNWSIKAKGKYIGPGFKSLAYPYQQADRMEASLEPMIKLYQNRIILNSSISHRINNISETKAQSSVQTFWMINAMNRITKSLNLGLRYSNFAFNNDEEDEAEIVSNTISYSINPSYSFKFYKINHNVSLTYGKDEFEQENGGEDGNSTSSQNITVAYSISLLSIPLTSSLSYSNFINELDQYDLTMNSINGTVGYRFFKNRLRTSLQMGYNTSELGSKSDTRTLRNGISINYKISRSITLSLKGSTVHNTLEDDDGEVSYRENTLRSSLKYRF